MQNNVTIGNIKYRFITIANPRFKNQNACVLVTTGTYTSTRKHQIRAAQWP
jgi:hypothetical protein